MVYVIRNSPGDGSMHARASVTGLVLLVERGRERAGENIRDMGAAGRISLFHTVSLMSTSVSFPACQFPWPLVQQGMAT